MTDKQRIAPDLDQHRAAWGMGLRFCFNCHTWVRAEEWHRQFHCVGTVGVCGACIEADDAKEKRVAPEAKIELRPTKTPPVLGALWSMLEEDE